MLPALPSLLQKAARRGGLAERIHKQGTAISVSVFYWAQSIFSTAPCCDQEGLLRGSAEVREGHAGRGGGGNLGFQEHHAGRSGETHRCVRR